MTALTLFAHGSLLAAANDAVRETAVRLEAASGYFTEASFLELADPDLPRAVERLIGRGASEIIVLPYLLAPGKHLSRDLPRIVDQLREAHKGVHIRLAEGLDGHPALVDILLDRVMAARRIADE
jgi:sirohydrochlorin ferrochelatase